MSWAGVTNLSPKEYTYVNKTKIKKNPNVGSRENSGKTDDKTTNTLSKKEKERVQKYFRNGVFRNRIFETFDNLYSEVPINDLVLEGSYKACREIMTNRTIELGEIKVNPSNVAKKVKERFPYEELPEETNNARKFFVAKICDITSEEILNYL